MFPPWRITCSKAVSSWITQFRPARAVDDFDDDELDDFPSETFAALERDDIAASQLPTPLQFVRPASGFTANLPTLTDARRITVGHTRPQTRAEMESRHNSFAAHDHSASPRRHA
jgi:hypothetical protein